MKCCNSYRLRQKTASLGLVNNVHCVIGSLQLCIYLIQSVSVYLLVCLFSLLETSVIRQICNTRWVEDKCNGMTVKDRIFLLLIILQFLFFIFELHKTEVKLYIRTRLRCCSILFASTSNKFGRRLSLSCPMNRCKSIITVH